MKAILEKSSCHTLDRYNLKAQLDTCGVGPGPVWDEAVSTNFNITYWPYVNANGTVPECIEYSFIDSRTNLLKVGSSAS